MPRDDLDPGEAVLRFGEDLVVLDALAQADRNVGELADLDRGREHAQVVGRVVDPHLVRQLVEAARRARARLDVLVLERAERRDLRERMNE